MKEKRQMLNKLKIAILILCASLVLTACSDYEQEGLDDEEPLDSSIETEQTGDFETSPDDTIEKENTPQDTSKDKDDMVDLIVYPKDQVVDVNIDIDPSLYSTLLQNAEAEEYYQCDITYNGYTLYDVAIRTKGNSSLRDVVKANDDRFSYNIDLNYYENQDLYGIDKLILNNLYQDPSMMAEYITYDALQSLDTNASRSSFVALSINGEYYGLYLSVEHVGNEFLDHYFGNSDGEMYKPDVGLGANLDYIKDNTNYSALINENSDDLSNESIIELMKAIEANENIEDYFNVDGYLKYLAVSTYTVNLDSYQGGAYHNYYLYNNQGQYEWIAWDLNMAFNGFPKPSLSDAEAISFLIDEPTIGAVSNYPLIESILSNEDYLLLYHQYLDELINGYFSLDTFEDKILELDTLISSYVRSDTNSFYSYAQYQNALYSESSTAYGLLYFVQERSANVLQQLSNEIPSTNNGQGNKESSTHHRP